MTESVFDGAFTDADVPMAAVVLQRKLGESMVLMHPGTGRVLECTDSAFEIFSRCDGAHQVAEIIASLCAKFATTEGEIADDVRSSIATFAQADLVSFERSSLIGPHGDGESY